MNCLDMRLSWSDVWNAQKSAVWQRMLVCKHTQKPPISDGHTLMIAGMQPQQPQAALLHTASAHSSFPQESVCLYHHYYGG